MPEYDRERIARLFDSKTKTDIHAGLHESIPEKASRIAFEQLELKSEDMLLDVGTGTGDTAIAAAGICRQVIGIDISEKSLEKARQKAFQKKVDNVTFAYGAFEEPCAGLDLTSYGITKILAVYSLHHLPDPLKRKSLQILVKTTQSLFSTDHKKQMMIHKRFAGLIGLLTAVSMGYTLVGIPTTACETVFLGENNCVIDTSSWIYQVNMWRISGSHSDPIWSPDGEKIVFVSHDDENTEIYIMDSDGGNVQRLTNNTVYDSNPVWTPDGKRIVFTSGKDGIFDIYMMDADGGNLRQLTRHSAPVFNIAWSPDGEKIAFCSSKDGKVNIYVMDSEGGNQKNLTDYPAYDRYPVWSPDGEKIAFYSDRDGNLEIYVMDSDGGNVQRLTNNPAHDSFPAWSPDREKIAFMSCRDGNLEIYVMDSDGGNVENLTCNPAHDWDFAWSPDGTKIAFTSLRDGTFEIYVMDSDGGNHVNVTNNSGWDWSPVWSPDGERIGFVSNRYWKDEIYVIDPDGGHVQRLTENPVDDSTKDFSIRKEVLFSSCGDTLEFYTLDAEGKTIRRTDVSYKGKKDSDSLFFVCILAITVISLLLIYISFRRSKKGGA
ncbi:MAG: hypothetical protein AYK19_20850 [Theionarchaea archaeon DG-70-1]|nr:MAG: hypothetical protein AYK19_20850 [Theionarchaea archaeon DG-70-1]